MSQQIVNPQRGVQSLPTGHIVLPPLPFPACCSSPWSFWCQLKPLMTSQETTSQKSCGPCFCLLTVQGWVCLLAGRSQLAVWQRSHGTVGICCRHWQSIPLNEHGLHGPMGRLERWPRHAEGAPPYPCIIISYYYQILIITIKRCTCFWNSWTRYV